MSDNSANTLVRWVGNGNILCLPVYNPHGTNPNQKSSYTVASSSPSTTP